MKKEAFDDAVSAAVAAAPPDGGRGLRPQVLRVRRSLEAAVHGHPPVGPPIAVRAAVAGAGGRRVQAVGRVHRPHQ